MRCFICSILALFSVVGCAVPSFKHERTEKISIESEPAGEELGAVPLAAIDLSTFNGAVNIKSHDSPVVSMQVKYTAYGESEEAAVRNSEAIGCEYAIDNEVLSITAIKPHGQWLASTAFELLVPPGIALTLQTSNGNVEVFQIDGPVSIETSNGTIAVQQVVGDVRARSSNGAIKIVACQGAINLRTSNGRIEYSGLLSGDENRIQTSNGAVVVDVDSSQVLDIDASTSNGRVKCSLPTQRVINESKKHFHALVGDGPLSDKVSLKVSTSNGSVSIESTPVEAELRSGDAIAL